MGRARRGARGAFRRAAACAVLLAQGAPQEPAEPAELFARAAELACAGRCDEARALYARIVERHAGTPEAKRAAARVTPSALLGSCLLVDHGPPANRVEMVVLGDGFELGHQRALAELAEDVPPLFERV